MFTAEAQTDAYHCQIDVCRILEGIQKPHKPVRLGSGQDIALDENVSDLRGSVSRVAFLRMDSCSPHPS